MLFLLYHTIFYLFFLGCTSPLQDALQQFEMAPTSALEQISLLQEEEREIAVLSVMRSRPNIKYCTLLSESVAKNRCIRMGTYAQNNPPAPKATIQQIQTKECNLHNDADTCWDLLAIEKIKLQEFGEVKTLCSKLSLPYWQDECRENKASLIAQQGKIQLGFGMCETQKACEERVLYNLAAFSVSYIGESKKQDQRNIQRNRDFITQQRKNIISELLSQDAQKAYVYGETFLFFVTKMVTDDHVGLTSSLPIESILIKNCNQAIHILKYNKWDLENLEEWQQHYMTQLSKTQRKHTPRKFTERDIPVPKEENRVAFSPFVLRSAIPQNPLADWTLCLLEGISRLEHVDTRLLVEAQNYPDTIIRNRAYELITYLNSTTPTEK